jgi:hypothetical protein
MRLARRMRPRLASLFGQTVGNGLGGVPKQVHKEAQGAEARDLLFRQPGVKGSHPDA